MNLILFFIAFFATQTGTKPIEINQRIAQAAMEQVGVTTIYAPGYTRIKYPNGDITLDKGVCADVVVRSFRKVGIDLQKEVHLDMSSHFSEYPKFWKMKATDTNIDHRRVPNLMKYLQRQGKQLSVTDFYKPGDIVAWQLEYGLYHIGIVSTEFVPGEKRYFMIHNIGAGAKKEDVLYKYKLIGHYRW